MMGYVPQSADSTSEVAMSEELDRLLCQKEIYEVLDGDTVLSKNGEVEIRMPYLSGPTLSSMSNDFGVPSCYGGQSRWCYVDDMMQNAAETGQVSKLLKMFFSNQKFAEIIEGGTAEQLEKSRTEIVSLAIGAINKRLFFGGNELKQVGNEYMVAPIGEAVAIDVPKLKVIDREYVKELSARAMNDVDNNRLDSALTEARTLLEEVFCYVIEARNVSPSDKGDINKLYGQVADLYNMHASKDMDKRVNTLISGLNKVISSIAEMRNKNSDAHGVGERRVAICDYHARLAVNSAATVADFILSVFDASVGTQSKSGVV